MNAEEVRKLSDEEITTELNRLRGHTYDLRTQRVTEKVEDTSLMVKARRHIARLMTEQSARRVAQDTTGAKKS